MFYTGIMTNYTDLYHMIAVNGIQTKTPLDKTSRIIIHFGFENINRRVKKALPQILLHFLTEEDIPYNLFLRVNNSLICFQNELFVSLNRKLEASG